MTRRLRIALAGLLAVIASGGAAALVLVALGQGGRTPPSVPMQESADDAPSRVTVEPPEDLISEARMSPTVEGSEAPAAAPPEPPIEEILAASGEDPGAVYYMSRVREAIREGNPDFARELLGQMRRKHANSILVSEAERLFEFFE